MEKKFTRVVPFKDLGCMNGWGKDTPEEYKVCCRGNHFKYMEVTKLGNCWTQYTCPICKIVYNVDSSD